MQDHEETQEIGDITLVIRCAHASRSSWVHDVQPVFGRYGLPSVSDTGGLANAKHLAFETSVDHLEKAG